jgi:hypothetical protein
LGALLIVVSRPERSEGKDLQSKSGESAAKLKLFDPKMLLLKYQNHFLSLLSDV